MKRLIILVLFLSCATVWAQDVVRDSVPPVPADSTYGNIGVDTTEENVIGAKPTKHERQQRREANILGTPVYYDANGNVRGSANTSSVYHRPKHHYLNNLSDRFCSIFAEGKILNGSYNDALGLSFTYLPERWGGYGSLMIGTDYRQYVSLGPALRLSDYDSSIDWQLFGGFITNFHTAGAEVGLRMATAQHHSEFCWTSASMGVAIVGEKPYLTFGASFDIIALVGAATLFFW
jgi:hypothetical protein